MTALFCPPKYNGEFVTLHYWNQDWGWQVTKWQFGKPKQHTFHQSIISATLEIVEDGFNWANWKMREIFDQDCILAGDQ